MPILYLIDTLATGGAERVLVDTVAELQRRGQACAIVCLQQEGALAAEARRYCPVYCLHAASPLHWPLAAWHFRRLLRQLKPSLVHAHLLDSCLFSRLFRHKGCALVNTYHNVLYSPANVYYSRWRHRLDMATVGRADLLLSVSGPVWENVQQALGRREGHVALPNFASPAFSYFFILKDHRGLRLLNVSNLKPSKNHGFALEFLLARPQLEVILEVAGEGSERPALERRLQASGERRFRLLGRQAISSAFHAGYDAFFMSSHYEGMPVALIEALSSGLPAILPDLPMLRQTAGEAAWYYGSEAELEAVLKQLLKNKPLLLQKSALARQQAARFSAGEHVSKLLELYNSI
jgi:glycosyltransferase involved in cell wall biosynthesis